MKTRLILKIYPSKMINNMELNNMSKSELIVLLKRIWTLLWTDEQAVNPEKSAEGLLKEWLL